MSYDTLTELLEHQRINKTLVDRYFGFIKHPLVDSPKAIGHHPEYAGMTITRDYCNDFTDTVELLNLAQCQLTHLNNDTSDSLLLIDPTGNKFLVSSLFDIANHIATVQ